MFALLLTRCLRRVGSNPVDASVVFREQQRPCGRRAHQQAQAVIRGLLA